MILDYDGVRRALTDHAVFSSDLSHVPGGMVPLLRPAATH
jgi:hypothetical protein